MGNALAEMQSSHKESSAQLGAGDVFTGRRDITFVFLELYCQSNHTNQFIIANCVKGHERKVECERLFQKAPFLTCECQGKPPKGDDGS